MRFSADPVFQLFWFMIYLDVSTVFEILYNLFIYTFSHAHMYIYFRMYSIYIYMCSRMLCIWLNLLNASTHPQLVLLLPFEGRAILTLLQDREVAVEVEGFHRDLTTKKGPGYSMFTRLWFQIFFVFTPIWGRWTHFDEPLFERGWFNHQLVHFWL